MNDRERFELFCHENNILIHFVGDLSTRIRGYCHYDGIYYNVVLNNKLCGTQLKKTTIHEIIHVMENHFDCSPEHIYKIEKEVDLMVQKMRYAWGGI